MDTDEQPQVILGSSSKTSTLADGTLRIQVDISPRDAIAAFTLFGAPGSAVALARIKDEVAVAHEQPTTEGLKTEWGEYARTLKLSDFFRSPAVWKAIGTDYDYLLWVKQQPSALSGDFDYYDNTGDKWCVAAHVRRVEHGSGTGIKPPYSAIPLTKAEHDLAHMKGDSEIGSEEWWAKQRIKYVSDWCWETLKAELNYESWAEIPPSVLVQWAKVNDLLKYLPNLYRSYVNAESEGKSG